MQTPAAFGEAVCFAERSANLLAIANFKCAVRIAYEPIDRNVAAILRRDATKLVADAERNRRACNHETRKPDLAATRQTMKQLYRENNGDSGKDEEEGAHQ